MKSKKLVLRPLAGKVVVKPDKVDEKTPGGLYLPDVAKERPCKGTVLAVGKGKVYATHQAGSDYNAPVELKAGDRVAYPPFTGHRLEDEDDIQIVMEQSEVLAVVEEG